MITRSCNILMVLMLMLPWLSGPEAAWGEFTPWDPLIYDNDYGPSWLFTYPTPAMMYTVNAGAFEIGFGLARGDGGARGMNALKFAMGPQNTGHLISPDVTGSVDVENTGNSRTFTNILLLVAVDAEVLPSNFSFAVSGCYQTLDCNAVYYFDNVDDFTFYDPDMLNYATGRPSGYYWATSPDSEPISYLFDAGMVTIYVFEDVDLGPQQAMTVNYQFENLRTSAVFSVYGYDEGLGFIYHTNRALPDDYDSTAAVSTFAVIPPLPTGDFDGDRCVNMVDFAYLSSCWGAATGSDPNEPCYECDLSGNGVVYSEDLALFADHYLDESAN